MIPLLRHFVGWLVGAFRSREDLMLENLPLRQQLLQRELFKTVLDEQHLRFDRDGRPRTAYSLRHTYICLRLMKGADIYQIAKNCRTSVEMINTTRRTSRRERYLNPILPARLGSGKLLA